MDKIHGIAKALRLCRMNDVAIASLHLHPVKSCRSVAVESAALDAFGLVGDRRFLIVDDEWNFLTQRNDARLALIETALLDGALTLRAPHAPEFRLSRDRPPAGSPAVTIFRDTVKADDMGDEVAGWLSAVLEKPCRLVRADANFARRLPRVRVPALHAETLPEVPVAFVDAFPVLVISEASLEDLNARLDTPLPMNRFRPNIVLRGAEAYAEDGWKIVRVGGVEFRAGGKCGRCLVTTTDQETGERAAEPLVTLARYRRDARDAIVFGQYWMHTGPGSIGVGDEVHVVA